MIEASKTLCMVGLPDTGKTTYLTAFYIATEEGSGDVSIATHSDSDRKYLNERMEELAECKRVTRTNEQDPEELRLMLNFEGVGDESLLIPDLWGERIARATEKRRIDQEFGELTIDSDAILLFLRPKELSAAEGVHDFVELCRIAGLDFEPNPGAVVTPDQWEIALVTAQVRLVDIVQELMVLRNGASLRLCLVISAWDMSSGEISPQDWTWENLPLLAQVLDSQPGIEWTVFGVSAQGGDFEDEEDRKRLIDIELIDRPIVAAADGEESNIIAPIRWALDT
jgi:hypothetical protein